MEVTVARKCWEGKGRNWYKWLYEMFAVEIYIFYQHIPTLLWAGATWEESSVIYCCYYYCCHYCCWSYYCCCYYYCYYYYYWHYDLISVRSRLTYYGLMFTKSPVLLFSLNWAPRHEGVSGEWRHSSTHSLTLELGGDEWSASRSSRFTYRERAPRTHWIGGWLGPRAVLEV